MIKTHSRDIHFLLFYSIWTLCTTLIQLVSVLFIAAVLHCPYSSLKFLILVCELFHVQAIATVAYVNSYNLHIHE